MNNKLVVYNVLIPLEAEARAVGRDYPQDACARVREAYVRKRRYESCPLELGIVGSLQIRSRNVGPNSPLHIVIHVVGVSIDVQVDTIWKETYLVHSSQRAVGHDEGDEVIDLGNVCRYPPSHTDILPRH